MNLVSSNIAACSALFVVMQVATFWGRKWRLGSAPKYSASSDNTDFAINSIFALLGLLLAFSFSSAYSRYEVRRQLIVEETNDIGTAYLRIDLLPVDAQPKMRKLFEDYVAQRVRYYTEADTGTNIHELMVQQQHIQIKIWQLAVSATQSPAAQSVRILLLPSLNAMIDISTTRTATLYNHIPGVILWMLLMLSVVCAFFVGENLHENSLRYGIIFGAVVCLVLYVIMDVDYPRVGLINHDETQQLLTGLAEQIKRS